MAAGRQQSQPPWQLQLAVACVAWPLSLCTWLACHCTRTPVLPDLRQWITIGVDIHSIQWVDIGLRNLQRVLGSATYTKSFTSDMGDFDVHGCAQNIGGVTAQCQCALPWLPLPRPYTHIQAPAAHTCGHLLRVVLLVTPFASLLAPFSGVQPGLDHVTVTVTTTTYIFRSPDALQAARPAREVSALQQRLSAAVAEAQGLREALDAAQERHSQQVTK
jgi:hypothetical protein